MADAVVVVAAAVMVELVEAWSFVVEEEVTAVVAVVVERTDNRVERAY